MDKGDFMASFLYVQHYTKFKNVNRLSDKSVGNFLGAFYNKNALLMQGVFNSFIFKLIQFFVSQKSFVPLKH